MANLSNRGDLAGTPSKATTQAALVALFDFIASRFAKGTAGVAAATDAELSSARESLGVGGFTGKNLLINGNFQVNQRTYVSGAATVGANRYTLDRWRVVVSGQSLSFSASGNGNAITAPAGGVEQVIEGVNIAGGTHVLNWTGTATATVNGTARAKGEGFTLPANTNATVRLIGGTASLVQLEPGAVPTPFEHLPIGVVRGLCRAYTKPVTRVAGQGFSATTAGFWYDTSDMRAAPTLSTNSGFTVTGAGGGTNSASVAIAASVNGDTQLNATAGAVLTAGDASVLTPPAGALWVAEL